MGEKRIISKTTFTENEASNENAFFPIVTNAKDGKIPLSMVRMQAVATCTTAAGTAAKTATITNMPDFELRNGMFITVYFQNANSVDSPSLNINSKGSWPLRCENQASGVIIGSGAWAAGALMTVQYVEVDSSNKFFVLVGHNVAKNINGLITQADGTTVYNSGSVDSHLNSALSNRAYSFAGTKSGNTFTLDFTNKEQGLYLVTCYNSYSGHIVIRLYQRTSYDVGLAYTIVTSGITVNVSGWKITISDTGTLGTYQCGAVKIGS